LAWPVGQADEEGETTESRDKGSWQACVGVDVKLGVEKGAVAAYGHDTRSIHAAG